MRCSITLMLFIFACVTAHASVFEEACTSYEKDASRGQPEAMYKLGLIHIQGQCGKPRNQSIGKELIKRAGNLGHSDAAYRYAQLAFDSGDANKAKAWVQKAANLGNQQALTYFGDEAYAVGDFETACYYYGVVLADKNNMHTTAWLDSYTQQTNVTRRLDDNKLHTCNTRVKLWKPAKTG